MELIEPNEVQIGDTIIGLWEVTAISKADHFGKPAIQFTFGQAGRLIVLYGNKVPVANS